ncbi:MAG: ATP-dependent DNA helicase [Acidiferrobacter sp.]
MKGTKGSARKRPPLPNDATACQREAFAALLPFCTNQPSQVASQVLSGYAGTGKTWLAVHLIRAACDSGLRVAVCAPTHKAVSVIATKIEVGGGTKAWTGTLHALLGLKLKETHDGAMQIELDRHPKATYFEAYDIVFIDESSMVGPMLLSYIERFAQSAKPRVLYVGDPGQLLPVNASEAATGEKQLRWDTAADGSTPPPPVFTLVPTHHHLTEIVRQKSTGKPHPIVQFAQELRRYIERETQGVFGPDAVRQYLTAHAAEMGGAVRIAQAQGIADGAVSLRRKRPNKDIRVIAWRNRIVDERNRFIHQGLALLYDGNATEGDKMAPFWVGETLVAREALYGFRATAGIIARDAKTWEQALAPQKDSKSTTRLTHGGELADLVPNNTEMVVQLCTAMPHPYLHIPSWHIVAGIPGDEPVEFFVADDNREYQQLIRKTWDSYRATQNRNTEDFRRAWAVTRACAPVMHTYAVTAHKAQGSTFHYALVDLADLSGMIQVSGADEYHRALYVAVTRATERVWLCL